MYRLIGPNYTEKARMCKEMMPVNQRTFLKSSGGLQVPFKLAGRLRLAAVEGAAFWEAAGQAEVDPGSDGWSAVWRVGG